MKGELHGSDERMNHAMRGEAFKYLSVYIFMSKRTVKEVQYRGEPTYIGYASCFVLRASCLVLGASCLMLA
jgi:hypothetical protein